MKLPTRVGSVSEMATARQNSPNRAQHRKIDASFRASNGYRRMDVLIVELDELIAEVFSDALAGSSTSQPRLWPMTTKLSPHGVTVRRT